MEQARNIYLHDGFEFKLSKKENRLSLEIQAPASGRSFSVELDSDAVPQLSKDIFSDVNAMYQGLEDALKGVHKEVTLSFDGEGNLEYRVFFSVGIVKKDLSFSVVLQEKPQEPWMIVEKRMEYRFTQVFSMFEDIESRVGLGKPDGEQEKSVIVNPLASEIKVVKEENKLILEAMKRLENVIFEKLAKLEQKVDQLEKSQGLVNPEKQEVVQQQQITETGGQEQGKSLRFMMNEKSEKDFVLLDDQRTVQRLTKNDQREISFSSSLPKSGVKRINLKLEKVEKGLWFGIISEQDMNKPIWFHVDLYYSSYKGDFYEATQKIGNQRKALDVNTGKTGDVLSMIFDIDKGYIWVLVNGIEVNAVLKNLKDKTYIPYIGTYYGEEKISII